MNGISSIYYVKNSYTPVVKQNADSLKAPAKVYSDVPMQGLDAIATYNFARVNSNNDFNIPTLTMIPVPENIEEIEGEKIYSEDGDLEYVVQDKGAQIVIYHNDKYKTIKVADKNSGKIIQEQGCYVGNSKEVRVCKDVNDEIGYFTDYDERDGKMIPVLKGKHIYYEDDTKKEFIHLIESNEYQLIERSNVSEDAFAADRAVNYDETGDIKNIEDFNY